MELCLTQAEILRRHALYQTSYTGNHPARTSSPIRIVPAPRKPPPMQKTVPRKTQTDLRKSREDHDRRVLESRSESLDYRQLARLTRVRPWKEKSSKIPEKNDSIKLFYNGMLPSHIDKSKVAIKSRRYVANSKYGDIYELRQSQPSKSKPAPKKSTWFWEDDFLIWQNGSREKYLEKIADTTRAFYDQRRSIPNGHNKTVSSSTPTGESPQLSPTSSAPSRLTCRIPSYYNCHRLEKTRRRVATVTMQRMFRGWYTRTLLKQLKKQAVFDHGKSWSKFVAEYKQLVGKIQSRYGVMKTSCQVNLKQIQTFMDNKQSYQAAFTKMSTDGKLHKDDLIDFFNLCDHWPTQRDVNRAFDTVFRGSGNTAEIVFLLDCSTSVGNVGFHNLIKFVRDIVMSLDVAPDRTRVGVIPYNEDVFSSFGITAHSHKRGVLEALSTIKVRPGLTRTDVALRLMMEMFKDSRPGVQKIGIVVSDGKSSEREKTDREAKTVHDAGVEVFTIAIGNDADEEELKTIATSPKHHYFAYDVKALASIKKKIAKIFCLSACGFCQYLLPRILHHGLLQHEAFDILWTLYPPEAANISAPNVMMNRILDLQKPPSSPSCDRLCRPMTQPEAMDVIWTCYPPEACGLSVKFSRWIRPTVNGKEAWSLLDDDIIKSTGIKACLRLVIQAKLARYGYINVPSDVRDGIEHVTNEAQAMEIVEKFIIEKMDNSK